MFSQGQKKQKREFVIVLGPTSDSAVVIGSRATG